MDSNRGPQESEATALPTEPHPLPKWIRKCLAEDSGYGPVDRVLAATYQWKSYKHYTLINYDSRVVPDLKIPHIMTLES